jgi:hypothetical protein
MTGKRATESGSFLKKRTKKLLTVWGEPVRGDRRQVCKSFLLLFFKKEDLVSACLCFGRLIWQSPLLQRRGPFFLDLSNL